MTVDRFESPKRPLPYSHSRTHSHTLAHSLAAAELKLASASSKGKQKESEEFHFGWWDFVPLLEPRRPPVQWTSSSLIVTAHPIEPRVACLHFPSNKHFTLPSPHAITASPSSYDPPTVISTSPRDDWIFAYFPGIDVDGVGCFWSNSTLVDDWSVKEWQTFARGDGVVAARWLNSDRQWCNSDFGTPARLPSLGPFLPSLNPVLIVVSEAKLCYAFYVHPQTNHIRMLSASLSRRSFSKDGRERPAGEQVDGPRGLGRCVHAAIGLGYDENSVIVSLYSSFVPSTTSQSRPKESTDMNLSLTIPAFEEPEIASNWETWKDEGIIEACEVNITVSGFHLTLVTTPLPSIRDFSQSGRRLTSMTFVPSLPSSNQSAFPSTPTQTHRRVTPQSSPATAPAYATPSPGRSVLRSPVKGAPPKPVLEKAKVKPLGALYLLCTTLELGQSASAPSSDIILYVFWRNPVDIQTWYSRRACQLALPSCAVVHLSPFQPTNTSQSTYAVLGVLNHEGQVTKRKGEQRLSVGKLQMLRLPELQVDDSWEPTNIVSVIGSCGVELPFSFAVSPNRALVCAMPSSSVLFKAKASTFIHQYPLRAERAGQEPNMQKAKRQTAASLQIALHRRITSGDIVHRLCSQETSLTNIDEGLATVLEFDATNGGLPNVLINEIIGMVIDVYRRKSLASSQDMDRCDYSSRYQTGLDICTLSACNIVWQDVFDGGGYDPDAVWHLTSLCGYFMEEFLEKLLKVCVQFASDESLVDASPTSGERGEAEPFTIQSTSSLHLDSPLLHLVHPYALDILHTFVQHVRKFRAFLGTHTKSEEQHQMAREVLIDTIDSSAVDLEALDRVLSDITTEVRNNAEQSPELAKRCLIALKPPPQYGSLSQKIISKLMQAQVVDKLQLFIKPADLIDGMIGLSMSSSGKMHGRDIITKAYLSGQNQPMTCLRCGGRSEIDVNRKNGPGRPCTRWAVWENTWKMHCVCGGLWSRLT